MKVCAAVRDVTAYLDPAWMKAHRITRAREVFVYSPDVAVHCCSLSPSNEVWPVRYDLHHEENTPQDLIEAAMDEAATWPLDVYYLDGDISPEHCRDTDEEYADAIESALEFHCGNHVV